MRRSGLLGAAAVTVALLLVAGCAGAPTTSPTPQRASGTPTGQLPTPHPENTRRPDPTMFVEQINNPWMPWVPGNQWVYRGRTAHGVEHEVVTVTDRTKVIEGVTCTVVHDVVRRGGRLLEDTNDWYAQDVEGNVWYFGEATQEFGGGTVRTAGSWEAGLGGARAGIALLARPVVGTTSRKEFESGVAEDEATVLGSHARTTVPIAHLSGLLQTRDFTRLEPNAAEHKYYAKGIGVVREDSVSGHETNVLVSMTPKPRGLL